MVFIKAVRLSKLSMFFVLFWLDVHLNLVLFTRRIKNNFETHKTPLNIGYTIVRMVNGTCGFSNCHNKNNMDALFQLKKFGRVKRILWHFQSIYYCSIQHIQIQWQQHQHPSTTSSTKISNCIYILATAKRTRDDKHSNPETYKHCMLYHRMWCMSFSVSLLCSTLCYDCTNTCSVSQALQMRGEKKISLWLFNA